MTAVAMSGMRVVSSVHEEREGSITHTLLSPSRVGHSGASGIMMFLAGLSLVLWQIFCRLSRKSSLEVMKGE